jgi:REP element-mobilizing transposase RayT
VGNDREDLFIDELDRVAYLRILERVSIRYEWSIGSYSLLGNHTHLGGLIPARTAPAGMQLLNGSYSRTFNKRWKRSGHRFIARYDDRVVENGQYLLNVIRYDVWNPVRHGFVDEPGAWKWSSYRATAGIIPAPKWLRVDLVLREFSVEDVEARRLFREFVAAGNNASNPWEGHGPVLGSEAFCDSMTQRMKDAMRAEPSPARVDPDEIVDAVALALDSTVQAATQVAVGRKLISLLALGRRVPVRTVAEILDCSPSTVSRDAKRCEDLAIDDEEVNALLQRAKRELE